MSTIDHAAALIAEFDPGAAHLYRTQPFRRHALVTALHRSMADCYLAPHADEIAALLRAAADAEMARLTGERA